MNAPFVFLLAGEVSGDKLGAMLAAELRRHCPSVRLQGVGGAAMAAAGVDVVADYRPLAVMGYWDALLSLPAIIRLRWRLLRRLRRCPPTLFIGIDAPDFNLSIAGWLRRRGVKTVQYVAPSVWMWRRRRLRRIARMVDAVWCLLPFEPAVYTCAGIPAVHVGHPAAGRRLPSRRDARRRLGCDDDAVVIALLPGSRKAELRRHLPLFAEVVERLRRANRHFVVAAADDAAAAAMHSALKDSGVGTLDDVLAAADFAVAKSGTVTLEVALAGTAMVVVYQASLPARWAVRWRRFALPFFSLPNILTGRFVVPELLLAEATAGRIAQVSEDILADENRRRRQHDAFAEIEHGLVAKQSAAAAAAAMLQC